MSSLSSSSMNDIFLPFFGKKLDEKQRLKISRMLTVFWAILLIFSAMIFKGSSRAVVEIALSIAAFTYGGLLGTFLLGLLFNNVKQKDALFAFAAGIVAMIFVIFFSDIGWTWYTLIGVTVTILAGILLSLIKTK